MLFLLEIMTDNIKMRMYNSKFKLVFFSRAIVLPFTLGVADLSIFRVQLSYLTRRLLMSFHFSLLQILKYYSSFNTEFRLIIITMFFSIECADDCASCTSATECGTCDSGYALNPDDKKCIRK